MGRRWRCKKKTVRGGEWRVVDWTCFRAREVQKQWKEEGVKTKQCNEISQTQVLRYGIFTKTKIPHKSAIGRNVRAVCLLLLSHDIAFVPCTMHLLSWINNWLCYPGLPELIEHQRGAIVGAQIILISPGENKALSRPVRLFVVMLVCVCVYLCIRDLWDM